MAYRYLIYSTGTTYSGTILKDNGLVVPTPSANTASFYTNFAIPEIQPLYLWQVNNVTAPTTLTPNSDSNVSNYENATAPPAQANDLVVYSELTGATANKIDKVTGQTNKIPVFTAGGGLQSGGYTIPELTGLTTYTFVESGGTTITQVGNTITIYSSLPTGTTVSWGSIVGNISNQTDLWSNLTYLSGATTGLSATKLDKSVFNAYTGSSQPILNKAITGVTNLGSGTTLGGTSARNITIKSISAVGGVKILTGDANNLIISGETGGVSSVAWGDITGTLSNQTDLWNTLTGMTATTATKLNTSVFNFYTGTTAPATYATISNFNLFTGTTLPANYYNKSQINSYTAQTQSQINNKLNISVFNTFTGTTLPATYLSKSAFNSFTGTTLPATYLSISSFNSFTGTTLPANYYNKTQINAYTGQTQTLINSKIPKVTGATANNIATFASGGVIQDSGKQFTTTVQPVGSATNNFVPTELAVRNAINSAVAAAVVLQGDWNATTNTPDLTLPLTAYTTGYAWRVGVSGTTDLGISGQTGLDYWRVGDLAIKGATTWIRVESQDISAVWGNITGTLSGQTDLWNALNSKLNVSVFNSFTGTTLPANYYNKAQIDSYTGQTQNEINSKLDTSVFTGYTASTKNKDKKIQLVSTSTLNVNVVVPTGVTWSSVPYSADTYLWSASSAITVYIKSAGTYEVQYHVLLKNDSANQTHSVGGYIVKNGSTLPNTATAAMVVGPNASGELSLPPVVQTFANNDKLVLTLFRIGNAGTVNLVANSTILTINKLT